MYIWSAEADCSGDVTVLGGWAVKIDVLRRMISSWMYKCAVRWRGYVGVQVAFCIHVLGFGFSRLAVRRFEFIGLNVGVSY